MRVNMDSSVVSDARFKKLSKLLGIAFEHGIGSCFMVWLTCYERRSEVMATDEVDLAAGIDGFASAMVQAGIAHEDEPGFVLIHGVHTRIAFLKKQKSKGKAGGAKSGQVRQTRENKANEAYASQKTEPVEANGSGAAQAYSPAPALSPAPASSAAPPGEAGQPREVFDPLRESERHRKDFEAAWNASGLRPVRRLTHTLWSRLDALLLIPEWAACWREALVKAGKNPWLAAGVGRRNGPLDPSEFLANDDFADSILRGKLDQHSRDGPPQPATPTVYADPNNLPTNRTAPPLRPKEAA